MRLVPSNTWAMYDPNGFTSSSNTPTNTATCSQPLRLISEVLSLEHGVEQVAEKPQRQQQCDPVQDAHDFRSKRSHISTPSQVSAARNTVSPRNHRSSMVWRMLRCRNIKIPYR